MPRPWLSPSLLTASGADEGASSPAPGIAVPCAAARSHLRRFRLTWTRTLLLGGPLLIATAIHLGTSLLVGLLYGAQLVLLLPTDERISWQGHLFGAIGVALPSPKSVLFYRESAIPFRIRDSERLRATGCAETLAYSNGLVT